MDSDRPKRTSTSVRFPPELAEQLVQAADERCVSVNWLVNRAVADFLPRLIPADEIRWTTRRTMTSTKELFADAETPAELLGLLAGAASVCWSTPEGAGVFDSERASSLERVDDEP